jgi:hypothetical protein
MKTEKQQREMKAQLERLAGNAIGIPVEVTIRGIEPGVQPGNYVYKLTFSAAGNRFNELTKLRQWIGPQVVESSIEHDAECDVSCLFCTIR